MANLNGNFKRQYLYFQHKNQHSKCFVYINNVSSAFEKYSSFTAFQRETYYTRKQTKPTKMASFIVFRIAQNNKRIVCLRNGVAKLIKKRNRKVKK